MRATVMFGACDVRIENIPDACIIEPAENAAAAASCLLSYSQTNSDQTIEKIELNHTVEGQSLNAEDELFVLMQAGQYLTATRGMAAPEARMCYERAEALCHSLGRPLLLYVALTGQWRYSLHTDKMSSGMQIAERICSLAHEQNDAALMIGAYRALASTLYFLGNFEASRQYAMHAVQVWRSGSVQSYAEEYYTPVVGCLVYAAVSE